LIRLGVDSGGTFTDFVWLDEAGRLRIHKELSTPADPARAILTGIQFLGVPDEAPIVHGTTVATNALLERRGARTGLITTEGFADVLAIGRQNRPELYSLRPWKGEPLAPRAWRLEVRERVTAEGEILVPLDPSTLAPIIARFRAEGVESVAVCLLFSFLRPEHEQEIGRALGSGFFVSLSSDILPEYREYERTATTVLNAYVGPLMGRYLERLEAGVAPRPLTIMQSNGGVISANAAARLAARTVLSGPAGGVVGARQVAGLAGLTDIITIDMGGTSTDVALCPGRLPLTSEGQIAGLPLRLPVIDIHTVGAGGGSLAYLDAGGALHVGPQSAGADPGPACYGLAANDWPARVAPRLPGGQATSAATTTDANLALGRLDAQHFLGGAMRLYPERARQVLAGLAAALGRPTVEAAAWDVIALANATMERAIRRVSVDRGHDPRRFTLLAFGGAGPLHACELATSLAIPQVMIPAWPGVLSALGMVVAAPRRDYSRTALRRLEPGSDLDPEWLDEQFHSLEERAAADMAAEGHDPAGLALRRRLDMRYAGQSHELTIAMPPAGAALVSLFHRAHYERYGYEHRGAAVEVVTVRLSGEARITLPSLPRLASATGPADEAMIGRKTVWFGPDEARPAKLYRRDGLGAGHRLDGPAIVFQYDTTTVIPPDWQARVDEFGNLLLERAG
jgi:N-methylhydantoinase A